MLFTRAMIMFPQRRGTMRGELRDAELAQRRVALDADLGPGEEGQEGDDADGARDQREAAGTEGDLGQGVDDLAGVAPDGRAAPTPAP